MSDDFTQKPKYGFNSKGFLFNSSSVITSTKILTRRVAAAAVVLVGGAIARMADVVDLGATVRREAADEDVDTSAGVVTRAAGAAEGSTFQRSAVVAADTGSTDAEPLSRMAAAVAVGATVRREAADDSAGTTAGVATAAAGSAARLTV